MNNVTSLLGGLRPCVLAAAMIAVLMASASAQRAPGEKPNPLLQAAQAPSGPAHAPGSPPRLPSPPQKQQIEQQSAGTYPDFQRSVLPLGAINKAWAEGCGTDKTTVAIAHRLDEEIRFRVRQLLGTVVMFPEPVSVVTAPGGTAFTSQPHRANGDGSSNVWVFGATQAGVDGNYAFVGSGRVGPPNMYLLRVQSEGYNSDQCPDLLVLVKPAASPELANAATAIQDWAAAMNRYGTAGQGAALPVAAAAVGNVDGTAASAEKKTGRGEVDWLAGQEFDPAKLDFRWTVRGDAQLAPDIVFSDCCSTYLKFLPERIDKVRIGAIHAVERTSGGAIDAPVNWSFKGDTIVVQGVQKLTIEREGIVTCIDPDDALLNPPAKNVVSAPVKPVEEAPGTSVR